MRRNQNVSLIGLVRSSLSLKYFWVALVFSFYANATQGQETCLPLSDCSKLKVEIIRLNDNVSPGCPIDLNMGCGDPFHQITFSVYLRYEGLPISTMTPFNLDYSQLNVAISLRQPIAGIQYSHIDMEATDLCYKNSDNGSYWNGYYISDGNKAEFNPYKNQQVSISFANLDPLAGPCGVSNGTSGNQITFGNDYSPLLDICGSLSTKCVYVKLFDVIVNAYPGESVLLQCDTRQYIAKSDPSYACDPMGLVNSGTHNGLYGGSTIISSNSYSGTGNADLEATLLAPVLNANGGYDFDVELKNNGISTITVNYIEFMIKASMFQLSDKDLSFTSGAIPLIIGGGPDPLISGNSLYFLHYLIQDNNPLAPGTSKILSKITVGPPNLSNQQWKATLSFQDTETKSRIATSASCTTLKTNPASQMIEVAGQNFCSDQGIEFKIEEGFGNCVTPEINIGLRSVILPAIRKIREISFDIHFDLPLGVTIDNVDFSNWVSVNCNDDGCTADPNHKCWEVLPDGKTLRYCMITTNSGAPIFSFDAITPFIYMRVQFSSIGNECIEEVELQNLSVTYIVDQQGNSTSCIPNQVIPDDFSVCGPNIKGMITTEDNKGINAAAVYLTRIDNQDLIDHNPTDREACEDPCQPAECNGLPVPESATQLDGDYGFCSYCVDCDEFGIYPVKDNNHLNGVSTFDLVLINKHILGIEALNSPYKMIAADANSSRSITTFDIVEIRKLILGIYTEFPNNTSWRFIDKSYQFPNYANPFQEKFPEAISCFKIPSANIDFTGVKIGDVNNGVDPSSLAPKPATFVNFAKPITNRRGETIAIPIIYTGEKELEAIQMGLRFSPAALRFISVSPGSIEYMNTDNFGLTHTSDGEIRMLWFPFVDPEQRIKPGTILFYANFQLVNKEATAGQTLYLDDKVLENVAWAGQGIEYTLKKGTITEDRNSAAGDQKSEFQVMVKPNPTKGNASMIINAEENANAQLFLINSTGTIVSSRNVMLIPGMQELNLPELTQLPNGVYFWKITTAFSYHYGHIIKQ